MKNYATNEYDAEIFITNYEETEKDIIVNYADGSNKIVENNENYKRVIKDIMAEQVLNNNTKKLRISKKKTFNKSIIILGINTILILITILLMFSTQLYLPAIILLMIESFIETLSSYKTIESHSIIKDIDKHILFIENQKSLNKAIENNKSIAKNINKNTKMQSNEEPLDINKIHKIKYIELKKMLEDIKKQKEEKPFIKEFKIKES